MFSVKNSFQMKNSECSLCITENYYNIQLYNMLSTDNVCGTSVVKTAFVVTSVFFSLTDKNYKQFYDNII